MQVPVSVVIPCYRCANTIERAVASVIKQTWPPQEILLVDDCSDDSGRTLASLHRMQHDFADKVPIKVIPLRKNSGPACARNAGWDEAQHAYIAFLDADDAWHPRKLELQAGWMVGHPEYGLSGHAHVLHDRDRDEWLEPPSDFETRPVSKAQALVSNPFATRTVMLRRELPFRFKKGKRYIEDYLLWLQIILSGIPSAYIAQPLAATYKADFGAGGLSARLWEMEKGELDAYYQVYKGGLIGLPGALVLAVFSLIKFVRRSLIVMMRRAAAGQR